MTCISSWGGEKQILGTLVRLDGLSCVKME